MTDEQTQKITPGKYVEITYNLYTLDGDKATLVHQVDVEDPERLVFGVTQGMIEPLEKALDGLTVGDEFSVKVTSDESFGARDPEKVVTLDKEIFLIDGKFDNDRIFVGAAVPMMTAEGFRLTGIVTEITDDKVTMDFNHPLAGRTLRFDGKVLTVRDATEEELHPVQGCQGLTTGTIPFIIGLSEKSERRLFHMSDCLFCKIIAGEIPSSKVYEDDVCYAFNDIAPQAPTHFLVIPKAHIGSVSEVNADNSAVVAHIFEVIAKLAKEMGMESYRVVSNIGEQAGQSVFHLHFHVLSGRES